MDHPPFSFWPYAVIPRKIIENGDAEDIITHENAHIRQGHTFDLIICELYTSLFWFNPFAWLLKRSVRLNHEFLADQELTRCTADVKNYQYRLLNIPEEFNRIQLAHSFNNLIKNRIVMINKKQTHAYVAMKILLIIPVVALIFAAFSCERTDSKKLNEINIDNQVPPPPPPPINGQSKTEINIQSTGEQVYSQVEQMPVYPGGERAMMEFIRKELKYPETAQANGVQGTVIVKMIVDKEGKVKDAKVLKGYPALDAEALRVINLMPAWEPGKMGGRPVSVSYVIPFKFVLN
jgi:TonB family protein